MAVYTIEKNEGNAVRIELKEFKGKVYLDIRQFFMGESGDWIPTKKGVTVPPDEIGNLIEILAAIQGQMT